MTRSNLVHAYARKALQCHRSARRFARWSDQRMARECKIARDEFLRMARTARNLMA